MIVDRPESHFIFIFPWEHVYRNYNYIQFQGNPLTNSQYLESWGKWILFADRNEMDEFAKTLDPYVENKTVPAAKYDRKKIDEFGLSSCVMCVYCHKEERDNVWQVLAKLGAVNKAWIYERETVEKWRPGGVNLETWIKQRGMSEADAELARYDANKRLGRLYEKGEEIFTGVEQ